MKKTSHQPVQSCKTRKYHSHRGTLSEPKCEQQWENIGENLEDAAKNRRLFPAYQVQKKYKTQEGLHCGQPAHWDEVNLFLILFHEVLGPKTEPSKNFTYWISILFEWTCYICSKRFPYKHSSEPSTCGFQQCNIRYNQLPWILVWGPWILVWGLWISVWGNQYQYRRNIKYN